jgi:hypothetical protein
MGKIADRTLERLGTTDRAIITARRMLLAAARRFQDGGEPPGAGDTYYQLRAYELVLPQAEHWYDGVPASLEEPRATLAGEARPGLS